MNKPTCFDCQSAVIDGGYSGDRETQPEPASLAECKNKSVPELLFEDGNEDTWPCKCGGFDPITIEKCGQCGLIMNVPSYNWPLVAYGGYNNAPGCSTLCTARLQEKFDQDIREQLNEQRGIFYKGGLT